MSKQLPKQFEDLIQNHPKPLLVDFWAEWCQPCKTLAPVLKKLAGDWGDKVTIIKINTEQKPHLAQKYNITGIPTLILFKNGQEVHRVSGALPLEALKQSFQSFLN